MRTLMRIIQTPVLSILFLTVFSLSNSENANAQGFKMGLSVNPNLSWMVSTDYDHTTDGTKLNFGFEFVADIAISENYFFGTGVHVFNTGGSISYLTIEPEGVFELSSVERVFSLKYVEIPLTFKMRTKEIGYSTIYGRFGLGVGLNIRAEAEERKRTSWIQDWGGTWHDYDGEWSEFNNPVVDSDIRIMRVAMIVGAGVERSLGGSSSLIIGATYNVGLLNIHKKVEQWGVTNGTPDVTASEDEDPNYLQGHDSFVELSLGILF